MWNQKLKKMDKLRSISKQSEKSTKSVLKKKRKATVGRIFAEKEGLKPGMKEWGDCSEIFSVNCGVMIRHVTTRPQQPFQNTVDIYNTTDKLL